MFRSFALGAIFSAILIHSAHAQFGVVTNNCDATADDIDPCTQVKRSTGWTNDDGTVTYGHFLLSRSQDMARPVSADSDLEGVCKTPMGSFDTYVKNSLVKSPYKGRAILIDPSGRYTGLAPENHPVIESVICKRSETFPREKPGYDEVGIIGHDGYSRASTTPNRDGSYKVSEPTFARPDMSGKSRALAANSDFNGVCVLMGFSRYVAGTAMLQPWREPTVVVSPIGEFAEFGPLANGSNPSAKKVERIFSLNCLR